MFFTKILFFLVFLSLFFSLIPCITGCNVNTTHFFGLIIFIFGKILEKHPLTKSAWFL